MRCALRLVRALTDEPIAAAPKAIATAIAKPEIEAVYGCTCCSRGLTSSKSIIPFQYQ
jgi:hypothetical protein